MEGRSETLIQKVALSMIPGVNAELVRNLMERESPAEISLPRIFPTSGLGQTVPCEGLRASIPCIGTRHCSVQERKSSLWSGTTSGHILCTMMTIPCFCGRYRMLPLCFYKIGNADLDAEKLVKYCRNSPSHELWQRFLFGTG